MEVKTVLRNLVTSQFMDEFDYTGTEFSFQTVFHFDTLFSYCMCTCAFEHEFVDYISETGVINEEKYEKIVKCIIDGKCPHVNQVPEDFVRETSIYGIHIACAAGTIKAIYESLYGQLDEVGKCYQITPASLIRLKKIVNTRTMAFLQDNIRKVSDCEFMRANKTIGNETTVSFLSENFHDFFGRINVRLSEECVLRASCAGYSTEWAYPLLRHAIQCNLEHTHPTIVKQLQLQYEHPDPSDYTPYWILCQEMIVFFDRSSWLETQLSFFRGMSTKDNLNKLNTWCNIFNSVGYQKVLKAHEGNLNKLITSKDNLSKLNTWCNIFNSVGCQKVLTAHWCQDDQTQCSKDQLILLMDMLFRAPSMFKETTSIALKQLSGFIPSISTVADERDEEIGKYLYKYNGLFLDNHDTQHPEVLKILLESGLVVDKINSNGVTPMVDLLQKFQCLVIRPNIRLVSFRQSVELYLFENIDINLNGRAVLLACEADKRLNVTFKDIFLDYKHVHLTGLYHMDVNKHSVFGHDNENNFALNFMAPMLLESGFPSTDISLDLNNDANFHPDEVKYLRKFQTMPRSLKVSCRNSLRNNFKGRQIHWFVKQTTIPKSIEDFILLRPLLKAVPKHLLDIL